MSETKASGTIVRDPEAVALNKVLALLSSLEPDARKRILAYANDKYGEVQGEHEL
jgi:hypothetical protein